MFLIFNKDKIISYAVAASIVLILFLGSISFIPNSDTKLIQVSSNVTNNSINNVIENNNLKIDNTYN